MNRLLIVNPTLGVGGVERKIADIASYLSQHEPKLRVDLVLEEDLPAPSGERLFRDVVQQSSFHLHCQPATHFIPFFLYLLYQVVRLDPDVILAFSRRPSILALTTRALLWWRNLPVVLGNDTVASQALKLYVPNSIPRRILQTQMRWLYPQAMLILAPSETSKRDLIEHFDVAPETIRVFKNWTRPVSPLNIPKSFDLIYVGRVDRVKQLTHLIQATGRIRQTIPNIRVVIVGDGNDMDAVQDAARAHGLESQIEFVGFQKDVTSYLAQSKIFCLTSRFEGLPIAALEAMAYGLPVVTLAYQGAEELVTNGETGFVCANEGAFCAALVRLLTDEPLRAQMGKRAREWVEREHGENVLAEYVNSILRL